MIQLPVLYTVLLQQLDSMHNIVCGWGIIFHLTSSVNIPANTEGVCGVSEVGSAPSKYCIGDLGLLRTPCATLKDKDTKLTCQCLVPSKARLMHHTFARLLAHNSLLCRNAAIVLPGHAHPKKFLRMRTQSTARWRILRRYG